MVKLTLKRTPTGRELKTNCRKKQHALGRGKKTVREE